MKGQQIYHIFLYEPKIVFTVIPKNANTSVKCSLLRTFYNIYNINLQNPDVFHSSSLRYFHFIDNKQLSFLEDHLKIAIVRNPFSRLFSAWNNKIKNLKKPRFGFEKAETFNNFIKKIYNTFEDDFDRHFMPQYRFVTFNNKILSNYIIKMEELDTEWPKLQELLKEKYNIQLADLPQLNTSSVQNYEEYYTEETRKMIEEKYKKDFQIFNY